MTSAAWSSSSSPSSSSSRRRSKDQCISIIWTQITRFSVINIFVYDKKRASRSSEQLEIRAINRAERDKDSEKDHETTKMKTKTCSLFSSVLCTSFSVLLHYLRTLFFVGFLLCSSSSSSSFHRVLFCVFFFVRFVIHRRIYLKYVLGRAKYRWNFVLFLVNGNIISIHIHFSSTFALDGICCAIDNLMCVWVNEWVSLDIGCQCQCQCQAFDGFVFVSK